MKLCWGLVTKTDALWVKVLRAKYNCGNKPLPEVGKKRYSSCCWKGILAVWEQFKRNLGKRVGDGKSTSFWFENWSNLNIPLIDLVPGLEGRINRNDRIVDYVRSDGEWNIRKLQSWFTPEIIDRIICSHPPCEERGEDMFFFKPSTSGCFSVKAAYLSLSAGIVGCPDSIWKHLWRWSIPEEIKSFMWLFCHGRAHTAQLRARRGIQNSDSCPFSCNQTEDSMHLLRDCKNAMGRWKEIVSEELWNNFASLEGIDWVKWNLNHEAGKRHTKKISWPTLFGYICWDIWVDRCKILFGDADQGEDHRAASTFFRACVDQDLLRTGVLANTGSINQGYRPQEFENFFRLEVDGSVLTDGRSGCGGLIRGPDNIWISGFSSKLVGVPIAVAELIGIIHGLYLCWAKNIRKVVIFSDCIEAINLAIRGCEDEYPFKDLVDEVRALVNREWHLKFFNVPRDELTLADRLAKFAHNIHGNYVFFNHPPDLLQDAGIDVEG